MNRDKRLRAMRQMESSADITIDNQEEALPSDFLQVRRLYITSDPKTLIHYMEPHVFWGSFAGSSTGKPTAYTIEGSNLVFGKAPDSTYTGKLSYIAKLPALVTNSTNWLLDLHSDIYLYASLIALAHHTRDDKYLATVAQMYEAALNSLKDDGRYGGALRYIPKVSP
jgi:hypothetical protein